MGMKLICEQAIKECELCSGTKNNEDKETEEREGLAHIFKDMLTNIYVDDMFLGAKDMPHAKALMNYIDLELGKYKFKVKGWSWSLKIITAEDPLSDENGYVTAFGCQHNTEQDTMNTKPGLVQNGLKFRGAIIAQKPVFTNQNRKKTKHLPPPLHSKDFKRAKGLTKETFGEIFEGSRKTLRLLVSKAATLYDPTGLTSALAGQLRDVVRQACLHTQGQYEMEVPWPMWMHFLDCFYEALMVSTHAYPRITDQHIIEGGLIFLIGSVDASF